MASPFDEPERNSYALRNKVEHFLRMENPEAARKLLQRVRMPGSVFAWNLVIRYYGKQRDYPSAYKTYQQVFPSLPVSPQSLIRFFSSDPGFYGANMG